MAQENPFPPLSRERKPNEKQQVDMIKTKAYELLRLFPVGAPQTPLAQQRLEEAVCWAVKGVTS